MVDHHEWRYCSICGNWYCCICSNNKENQPETCNECYEVRESHLRFHFYPLLQKVVLSEDPLALSNYEDFELYHSGVFELHPELLYHPVIKELYDYMRAKFF